MAQTTAIEWTDLSWNPTHGCSKVSPGCAHCYAETLSLRYRQTLKPWTPANAAENVILKPHKLREPLSGAKAWRGLGAAAAAAGKTEGKLVFVNSTSDLFHEQVPDEFIGRVFAVMACAPQHTFQILTKRPERMAALLDPPSEPSARYDEISAGFMDGFGSRSFSVTWPLPNVWLGVSIENRRFVGRADLLRQTPAAVRFISAEPLLGPLVGQGTWVGNGHGTMALDLTAIDWLIVGGESGAEHRPMDVQWARDLRDAARCAVCEPGGCTCVWERSDGSDSRPARTAFFMKQLGGARPGTKLEDLPEDLRIREMPSATDAAPFTPSLDRS